MAEDTASVCNLLSVYNADYRLVVDSSAYQSFFTGLLDPRFEVYKFLSE